ncbi:sensor histidine kinase [Amycolatopsis sp. NPDC049252]|uniref:sensor histidine kinase n=1 Tax=Amycolatopsis sp. NPDC049252 TaxID=3363933 RepID=UPI0037238AB5
MPAVTVVAEILWFVVTLCLARAWRATADRRRGDLVRKQVLDTLSAISEFRRGLGAEGARKLRVLLDVSAVVIADTERAISWDGTVEHEHIDDAVRLAVGTLVAGWSKSFSPQIVSCGHPACPVRYAVTAPLKCDGEIRAVLVVYSTTRSTALAEIVRAVGGWASDQLGLGESERLRIFGEDAPLFVEPDPIPATFIAWSFAAVRRLVQTEPERASELLREFADFMRYRSRQYGEFTELAEEVRCVDQYLALVQEHLGAQLAVVMDIAPEVLPLKVPFLCLQPLVEGVVQHGPGPRGWRVAIAVIDCDPDIVLSIEHEDPRLAYEDVPRITSDKRPWEGRRLGYRGVSGLPAFTRRMRHLYGDDYALEVDVRAETNTKITVRLPKK